jgi:DNA replication protein DnaC
MAHVPEAARQKYRNMEKSTDPNQRECDILNSTPGGLTDYDCPDCLNRGVIYRVDGNYIVSQECHCMETRRSMWNIKKSGIASLIDRCTFENFQATDGWQKDLKSGAESFLSDHTGKWFYAGGQVGCGKTHICTAICGEMLKQGKAVRYMLWRDEIVKLKSAVNDNVEYPKLINPFKTVPVLYVDDFLKTGDTEDGQKKKPTQGDINVAFEIFNYRYINRDLVTIISSERSIDDLLCCDEATGSRIYQRTKDYCFYFRPDKKKNYRLR